MHIARLLGAARGAAVRHPSRWGPGSLARRHFSRSQSARTSRPMRNVIAAALTAAGDLLGCAGGPGAAADSACTSMGGDVEGEQTCHVHAANSTYTLDMKFPLDYSDEQALTDYLSQNRDGFVNVAQTSGTRDVPYQM